VDICTLINTTVPGK